MASAYCQQRSAAQSLDIGNTLILKNNRATPLPDTQESACPRALKMRRVKERQASYRASIKLAVLSSLTFIGGDTPSKFSAVSSTISLTL